MLTTVGSSNVSPSIPEGHPLPTLPTPTPLPQSDEMSFPDDYFVDLPPTTPQRPPPIPYRTRNCTQVDATPQRSSPSAKSLPPKKACNNDPPSVQPSPVVATLFQLAPANTNAYTTAAGTPSCSSTTSSEPGTTAPQTLVSPFSYDASGSYFRSSTRH
ncbi:hypothetical protein ACA910_021866 [Epithemia clementina (nom. ined.)]